MKTRPVHKDEIEKLVQLGENTGIFAPGETEQLLGNTLVQLMNNDLPKGHQAHVLENADGVVVGWMYLGPTEDSEIWNIWWIGVDPQFQGNWYGKILMRHYEETAANSGAKTVIVETSSKLERTKEVYGSLGYVVSNAEKDGYGPGEDKITFSKSLNDS